VIAAEILVHLLATISLAGSRRTLPYWGGASATPPSRSGAKHVSLTSVEAAPARGFRL